MKSNIVQLTPIPTFFTKVNIKKSLLIPVMLLVAHHVWKEYLEKTEDIRHTTGSKGFYALRSQPIKRVFADAKELHGMRYAKHKGLSKVKMELNLLTCLHEFKEIGE